jgi:hypothetical protein
MCSRPYAMTEVTTIVTYREIQNQLSRRLNSLLV